MSLQSRGPNTQGVVNIAGTHGQHARNLQLNLISGIRACLKGIDNESLKEIQELLVWFEGLQTSSPRIWEFLNKGTHEESERDDFDATIVKQILDKSILLDTKVKGKWVTKTA